MTEDAFVHVPTPLYWLMVGFVNACTEEILFRAGREETQFEAEDELGEEADNGDTHTFGGALTGPFRDDGFRDWAVQISYLSSRNMSSPANSPEGYSDQTYSVTEAFHLMRDALFGYGCYQGEKLNPLDVCCAVEDTLQLFSPSCWTGRVQAVPPYSQAEGFAILLQLSDVPELRWIEAGWRRDFWIELTVFVPRETSRQLPVVRRRKNTRRKNRSEAQ